MKAVCSYSLRLLEDFNQKNKVRMVNIKLLILELKWCHLKEIKTESIKDFKEGIRALKQANVGIQSITIDGKRGYINNIKKLLGNIPVQMYLQNYIFHLRKLQITA